MWRLDSKHIHKKMDCPWCGGRSRFTPVIDEDGNILEGYGRCDRINSCEVLERYPNKSAEKRGQPFKPLPPSPRKQSHYLTGIAHALDKANVFTRWIVKRYGFDAYIEVNKRFQILTIDHDGFEWVVWLQTDVKGNIHTGKMMRYEIKNNEPKRVKTGYHMNWLHSALLSDEDKRSFTYTQTLFGSTALTRYPNRTVCVVESEKTAVIATIYFPNFVWVAVGGASNLVAYNNSCSIMAPLKNRKVILFPDNDQRESSDEGQKDWLTHCKTLQLNGFNVAMGADLRTLENWDASESADIADYLLQTDPPEDVEWKRNRFP